MKPPRVIFVNRLFHPDHSASSQMLSDLAFSVADDFEVIVVAGRQRYGDPGSKLAAREVVRGVRIHRVASTRFGRAGLAGRLIDLASFHGATGLALLRLARRGDVVIVKTDPPLLSIMVAWAARLKQAKLINWLQDIYPEIAVALGVRGLDGVPGRRLKAMRNRALIQARKNVVIGERMAAHLRLCGAPPASIQVIANWIDESAVTPIDHGANPLRRAWGLEDKFVVGYSGNLGRVHEFETMLGAARALRDDPSIVFLMIGGGYATAGLRAAVRDERLANVVFQPYQPADNLRQSLGVADVHWVSLKPPLEDFVLPSKIYGVLAAGRATIAITARDGESARLVEAHGCGLQVDPGDHVGLTSAIRALAGDRAAAARMGGAARTAAMGAFSRRYALAQWRAALTAVAEEAA
jgi:colanic acid biosynthesis glycosyl transferase WcaI